MCYLHVFLPFFLSLAFFLHRLSDYTKQLLNELGSGFIQNVNFRDNWAFVGQKGIKGFGEIEQVKFGMT